MKKEPSAAWLDFRQNAPACLKKWSRAALVWLRESFRLEKEETLQACRDGFWLRSPLAVLMLVLCTLLPLGAHLKPALGMGLLLTGLLAATALLRALLPCKEPKDLRPGPALMRGLTMGLGFTLVLCLLAAIREKLGSGSLWGLPLFGEDFQPLRLLTKPAGGLLLLGSLGALARWLRRKNPLPGRIWDDLPVLQGETFAPLRQSLAQIACPKAFRGVPILLVTAGLLLMVAGALVQ